MNADHFSTLVGGGYGMYVFSTVKWELVPHGELVKIGASVFFTLVGIWLYKQKAQRDQE